MILVAVGPDNNAVGKQIEGIRINGFVIIPVAIVNVEDASIEIIDRIHKIRIARPRMGMPGNPKAYLRLVPQNVCQCLSRLGYIPFTWP